MIDCDYTGLSDKRSYVIEMLIFLELRSGSSVLVMGKIVPQTIGNFTVKEEKIISGKSLGMETQFFYERTKTN